MRSLWVLITLSSVLAAPLTAAAQRDGATPESEPAPAPSYGVGPAADADAADDPPETEPSDDKGDDEDDDRPRFGWAVLPGAWFSTDRGLGLSASALFHLPIAGTRKKPSELGFVGIFTTRGDNVLRIAPTLRLVEYGYQIEGRLELGKRGGSYFGMGNDTSADDEESYEFNRYLAEGSISRRWGQLLYLGFGWDASWATAFDVDEGGALAREEVLGTDGGAIIGLGLIARIDTRDRSYGPSSGMLLEASADIYNHRLGSRYDFGQAQVNARVYAALRPRHIIAAQFRAAATTGEVPFRRLPSLGSASLLRGIASGRFRDSHFVAAQLEYRTPFWWRLGAVVFAATGRVGSSLRALAEPTWRTAGGAGVRFALKRADHIHLRADAGFTADGYQIYINLREAF
ncbi:MAG: BamA/TamA family outer membrane protein [Haliangiales bacterium]